VAPLGPSSSLQTGDCRRRRRVPRAPLRRRCPGPRRGALHPRPVHRRDAGDLRPYSGHPLTCTGDPAPWWTRTWRRMSGGGERTRAHRMIAAAEAVGGLLPIGNTQLPANEGQARGLARAPEAVRGPVWTAVVNEHGIGEHGKRLLAVDLNLARRQLTDAQKTVLGEKIRPDVATIAVANTTANLPTVRSSTAATAAVGRTTDVVAARVGLGSGDTFERGTSRDVVAAPGKNALPQERQSVRPPTAVQRAPSQNLCSAPGSETLILRRVVRRHVGTGGRAQGRSGGVSHKRTILRR